MRREPRRTARGFGGRKKDECQPQLWAPPKELKSLHSLDLSNSGRKELPKSVGELKHLRCLRLHNTNMSTLPESLGRLYNLKLVNYKFYSKGKNTFLKLEKLVFENCSQLKDLPELKNLPSLVHMEISDCPIVCLPKKGLPTTLQFLSINNCPKLRQRRRDERGEDWPKLVDVF
ncbi:unnamed protein product [Musa banksii]